MVADKPANTCVVDDEFGEGNATTETADVCDNDVDDNVVVAADGDDDDESTTGAIGKGAGALMKEVVGDGDTERLSAATGTARLDNNDDDLFCFSSMTRLCKIFNERSPALGNT